VVRPRATPALGQIGARIRAERRASGLSQEEAAGLAQVGYKHWQEIEGGRANPTVRTLVRIAEALGVDLCAILCAGKAEGAGPKSGKRRSAGAKGPSAKGNTGT
jgi:transcriptional regulator with XRE-family HTH domain